MALGPHGESVPADGLKIAYLCLQSMREGQASHAHVSEIAAGLRRIGHVVTVFSPSYSGEGSQVGPFRRLRECISVQTRLIKVLSAFDLLYIRSHPLAYPTAAAARRKRMPVVQESNGPYSDFYLAWPAARLLRFALEPLAQWQYRSADSVVAVTAELAEWVNHEASRDDTVVVPSGANTRIFRPDARLTRQLPPKYVVFFGSLAPWQGVQMMLDAAASPAWPQEIVLVIAGDGRLRDRVAAAAARDGRVVYLGRVPYEELGGVVAHSVASLITKQVSVGVTLKMSPLKLYESMAAGVPVIVSDFPDLRREVEPVGAGLVVPRDDAEALAAAVSWLNQHPEEARAMGSRGHADVLARHSWDERAERTARVIEAAAARRRSSGSESLV